MHTFTNGVTLRQAGTQTITATDTVTGRSPAPPGRSPSRQPRRSCQVTRPVAHRWLGLLGHRHGQGLPIGNTSTGYTGTVHFTRRRDDRPTLPADYTFVGGDNGAHTFTNGVTLTQAGNRTVTATDTVTGSITGTSGTIAVAAASAALLTVSAPANATAGSAFSVTVTALDTFGNTATGYTGTVHFTGGGTSPTPPPTTPSSAATTASTPSRTASR